MLSPASLRLPLWRILRNCSIVIFSLPTSMSVPTTALTMFLRKRLAVISKYQVVGGLYPSGGCYVADGGLVVATRLAERCIVFVMQKMLSRLVHLLEIQGIVYLQ